MDYNKWSAEYSTEIKRLEQCLASEKSKKVKSARDKINSNRRIAILRTMLLELKTAKAVLDERGMKYEQEKSSQTKTYSGNDL